MIEIKATPLSLFIILSLSKRLIVSTTTLWLVETSSNPKELRRHFADAMLGNPRLSGTHPPQRSIGRRRDSTRSGPSWALVGILYGRRPSCVLPCVFLPQRYTTAKDESALAQVRAAGTALVRKRLDLLEAHLVGRTYIVGDTRTYVDAYSVPMIRWASSMLPGGLDDWPAVKAHHERMLADAGVERAMRDEGLIEN